MKITTGKPYDLIWICPKCGRRQLRSDFCRGCAGTREEGCTFYEPRDAQELKEAQEAYAASGETLLDAMSGVFCSHCGRRVSNKDKFCPGCGHQVDSTDALPEASVGGQSVDVRSLEGYRLRETDDTGYKSAGGNEQADGIVPIVYAEPSQDYSSSHEEPAYHTVAEHYEQEPLQKVLGMLKAMFQDRRVWLGLLFAGIIILLVWFLWPRYGEATVSRFEYQPYVQISYIRVEKGSCWEGDCPVGYVELSSSEEDYYPGGESIVGKATEEVQPWGEVQIGTESEPGTIEVWECTDGGPAYDCSIIVDGKKEPRTCEPDDICGYVDKPGMVDVPIMATMTPHIEEHNVMGTNTPYPRTKIDYTRDVTEYENILGGWTIWNVGNDSFVYPNYILDSNRREQFTGDRGIHEYKVVFTKDGEEQTLTVSEDLWFQLQEYDGQTVSVRMDASGRINGVDLP